MILVEKMNEVKLLGEEIKKQGLEYDLLMEKMYKAIQNLQLHWTGNQADYLVFLERVMKEEENMRKVGKIIQQYGQVLEDISSNTLLLSDSIKSTVGGV